MPLDDVWILPKLILSKTPSIILFKEKISLSESLLRHKFKSYNNLYLKDNH